VNENTNSNETLTGVALLVGLLLVALLLVLIAGLQWYLDPENKLSIVQRRDLVQGLASAGQALAVFLTGAVGLIGLFFTWQSASQSRVSTQQTLELTEQGQITDRFTKAIEQLSATSNEKKNLEMRLGGIHALERISRESENDYWPIMEILAAYVREHAPQDPAAEADVDDIDKGATKIDVEGKLSFRHADTEIQAILDTIGRRSRTWPEEERIRIRLERTDLRGAQFVDANLSGLWFLGADLRGAYFQGCNVEGAVFTDAKLKNAMFQAVDLRRAGGLTQDHIEQSFGYGTELPDYLRKPAHWDRENSSPA
jgi:hypothetical protein